MKVLISLSLFICSSCNLFSINDSIPTEGKVRTPVSNARRIPTMKNPRNMMPFSDRSYQLPSSIQTTKIPQPILEHREMPTNLKLTSKGASVEDQLIDPWGFVLTDRHLNRWYRDIKGIRGMLDYGGVIGIGQDANMCVNIFATVGYQFNPIFFVGVGQGYNISVNKQESFGPTYIMPRINFLDENTTPFFDLKFGYSFIEGKGLHINPNFGFSFGRDKQAWNISAGYSFQKAKINKKGIDTRYNYHGVVLRVGYEFNIF